MSEFLDDIDPRRWRDLPAGTPDYLTPVEFYYGSHPEKGRDIVLRVTDANRPPARGDIEKLWQSMAQTMVQILAVRYSHKGTDLVDLVGGRRKMPEGAPRDSRPRPLVVQKVPITEARNFCRTILAEETPFAANRLVARWMDERATDMPGLKNDGLFARHALLNYVPDREDWPPAGVKAAACRERAGRDLVKALGFSIDDSTEPNAALLTAAGETTAAALFLEGAGSFDEPSAQYGAISPVTHALAVARRHRVRWVVLTRGRSIRLHPVSPDLGVGRRGRSTTYVEINLQMLPEDRAAYLWLLFSADGLTQGGTVDQILHASERFANDLGARLRERVYNDVVPELATALGRQLGNAGGDSWLDEAYHRTMVVLFRLLFVAYAEDKGLLPYERNVPYTNASLKSIARELIPYIQGEQTFSDDSAVFWRKIVNLWRAVDKGKPDWGVPAYNGGLFSATTGTGAALDKLELSDAEFGMPLARLLVDTDPDGVDGPVDFRSLSVREFGSIYEGLLESELSVAEVDLTVDRKGVYLPAKKGDKVEAAKGEVYFHNRSGARKSSGSYFTKPFAVEHLLDHALEPAIADHFERVLADIERGDDAAATRRFFDFRCVDIAMGSGHFLVAAVDRLEARFSEFLDTHPIPGVTRELETLRNAALNELHHCADDALIENSSLLRRQIARRCIYGVDLNPVSVELARLAIWIHTFVPGLPLSFLDHNLVTGNSLTGIGTLDEALDALGGGLGSVGLDEMLEKARPALERLASVTDATVADVKAARAAHDEALGAIADVRKLFDVIVLDRAGLGGVTLLGPTPAIVNKLHRQEGVAEAISDLDPLHYPIAFPEVFLRDRPGFDCILGNPPWEKLHVEEHQWWGLRAPGIRGLPTAQMNREVRKLQTSRPDLLAEYLADVSATDKARQVLMSGPYPDLGSSHPDLYKAFSWRFWQLTASLGGIGVVLPRAALASSGMSSWRNTVLENGDFVEVTTTTNTGGWVFDDAEHRYTIAFVSIRRTNVADDTVSIRGPFNSFASYRIGLTQPPFELPVNGLKEWTSGTVFPLIPGTKAGGVFLKLRSAPRLDSSTHPWTLRAVQGDLNATTGKSDMIMATEGAEGQWPVYKGSSFNLWKPSTGEYYASADPEHVTLVLQARRRASVLRTGSAFAAMTAAQLADPTTLPCRTPRIAFRDVARATDSRTLICALIPPDVILTHKAPYLLRVRGDARHEAYLLGVLSSIPLDWFARRLVETSVSFDLLHGFPIPQLKREHRWHRLVEISGRLAAVDERYGEWASAVGVPVASVKSEAEKNDLIAELDAVVSHLYGLNEDDVTTIFETFHVGWDYTPRLTQVLEHFRAWEDRL